jgi:hypothetical protein
MRINPVLMLIVLFLVSPVTAFGADPVKLPMAVPLEDRVARLEASVAKLQVDVFLIHSHLPQAAKMSSSPCGCNPCVCYGSNDCGCGGKYSQITTVGVPQTFSYKTVCGPDGCQVVKVANPVAGNAPNLASYGFSVTEATFATEAPRVGFFGRLKERRQNRQGFFGGCASCGQ